MTRHATHDDFIRRVNYVERCFLNHTTNSRAFDDCFEQYDGAAVVTALVRRAQTDPTLYAAIAKDWREGFPTSWIETEAQYASWPTEDLPRLAHELRTTQGQGASQQRLVPRNLTQSTDTATPFVTHTDRTIDTSSTMIPTTHQATQTERHLMDQSPVPLMQPHESAQFFQPDYDQSLTTFDLDPTQWSHLASCRFGPARPSGFDPRVPWSGESFRYDLFERPEFKRLAIRRQHGGGTLWYVQHEFLNDHRYSLLRLIFITDHEPTRWDYCHFLCDALERTEYAAHVSERDRWTQAVLQKRVKIQRRRGQGTALIIPAEIATSSHTKTVPSIPAKKVAMTLLPP